MERTLKEAVTGHVNLNGGVGADQTAAQHYYRFMEDSHNYNNNMYDHIDSEFGFLTINMRAKIEQLMKWAFMHGHDEGKYYMKMLDVMENEREV